MARALQLRHKLSGGLVLICFFSASSFANPLSSHQTSPPLEIPLCEELKCQTLQTNPGLVTHQILVDSEVYSCKGKEIVKSKITVQRKIEEVSISYFPAAGTEISDSLLTPDILVESCNQVIHELLSHDPDLCVDSVDRDELLHRFKTDVCESK